ncbi:MAG: N-acetylneuraminate synthase family protein [Sedimentisphaerales bacterium]|nr:N-acetylneuraminate synthase family protein [Sedimentisphaerales bacterium]
MIAIENVLKEKYCGQPYVIAEAGVNHNGSVELALELIEAAVKAGADCVKFQAFSASELVTKDAAKASYQVDKANPQQSQFQMLQQLELDMADFLTLTDHCKKRDIDFLVTPFSIGWARELLNCGLKCFKVSSGHITSIDFLCELSSLGLPVILSTGMSSITEVAAAVNAITEANGQLALLHCVSLYPTPLDKVNLRAMTTLHKQFGLPVGFSDHTVETFTGALATAAGAVIIEKHLTLDNSLPGPDHAASLNPAAFTDYVSQIRTAGLIMGDGIKQPANEEIEVRNVARLSLAAACDIVPGTVITERMLTAKRPGTGIPPADKVKVLGQKALRLIEKGQIIDKDCIDCQLYQLSSDN